jgi:hypothetical protein
MLLEQTLEKLQRMKLGAMAEGVREQACQPAALALSFEERLGLLVDREWEARENRGLTRRLQVAHLRQPASIENLEFGAQRGLDRGQILALAECRFLEQGHHVLITGATGAGKPQPTNYPYRNDVDSGSDGDDRRSPPSPLRAHLAARRHHQQVLPGPLLCCLDPT